MNEIERRYELKTLELEARMKASERKMADISYNQKQILQKNNFTKERFEILKKKLKNLPVGDKPKLACQKARVLGSNIEELKTSLKECRKELIVLKKDLSKEKKVYLQKKNLMECIQERSNIQKQEKTEISEMKEQDSLIEDLLPYKVENLTFSLVKSSDTLVPSYLNENPQKQDTFKDTPSERQENFQEKKEQKFSSFKQHSLSVEVQSERGNSYTIDVHDGVGLSVNILAPTECEKSSLLREKEKLKKELSSLGIPLSALLIRKRGE